MEWMQNDGKSTIWNECRKTANLQYGMNVGRRQIYNMELMQDDGKSTIWNECRTPANLQYGMNEG